MVQLRGWGLLLVVSVPLLVLFSWSQLEASATRINLERYENWVGGDADGYTRQFTAFFQKTRKLPVAGDITLPPIPANSGIKAWSLQADGIYRVEIDAKVDGRAVVLQFVPLVRNGVLWFDCVSSTSAVYVGKVCYAEVLKSEADIPAQLQANAQAMQRLPAVIGSTGEAIPEGTLTGSVLVAPAELSKMNDCGYQCVKPLSCANERPLLCFKTVDERNARWQEYSATGTGYRGTNLATVGDANKICEQSFGVGYGIAHAANLGGKFKITPLNEYWVHNDVNRQGNCWAGL
jgi:hypothetical protein